MTTTSTRATFSWRVMRPLLAALAVLALNGVLAYLGTLHASNATATSAIALGAAALADVIGWLKSQSTPEAEAQVSPLEAEVEKYAQEAAKAATDAAIAAIRNQSANKPRSEPV